MRGRGRLRAAAEAVRGLDIYALTAIRARVAAAADDDVRRAGPAFDAKLPRW